MNPLSKLQSEAVLELQNYECTGLYCNHETSDKHYIIDEQFLTDQIQKAYEAGLKDAVDKYFLDAEERLSIQSKGKTNET